jgi:hypothetical protein
MNTGKFKSGPLAKSEVCLIDSANKIREAIPVSKLEDQPKKNTMRELNDQFSD